MHLKAWIDPPWAPPVYDLIVPVVIGLVLAVVISTVIYRKAKDWSARWRERANS